MKGIKNNRRQSALERLKKELANWQHQLKTTFDEEAKKEIKRKIKIKKRDIECTERNLGLA